MVSIQCESASVEDCVNTVVSKSKERLHSASGFIYSSKISLSFGAFMNLNVTLLLDTAVTMDKGVLVEHATGRNRGDAISKALELLNTKLPEAAKVIDFEVGTYTTPVTRRTYGVAVAVYNISPEHRALPNLTLKERRALLAHVLQVFNYNPKVLNISELARTFGVSRDSIYYDIEQILKENELSR